MRDYKRKVGCFYPLEERLQAVIAHDKHRRDQYTQRKVWITWPAKGKKPLIPFDLDQEKEMNFDKDSLSPCPVSYFDVIGIDEEGEFVLGTWYSFPHPEDLAEDEVVCCEMELFDGVILGIEEDVHLQVITVYQITEDK